MLPLFLKKTIYRDYRKVGFRMYDRLGSRWLLHYRNYVDRKFILKRPYEDEQMAFLAAQVKDRGCTVFLDVGANFGLYTVQLLKRCDSLTSAYAIEPQPRNFQQLCANILINDLSERVISLALGASSERKQVSFLENKGNSTGTSRIAETAPESTKGEKFRTTTIDVDALDNMFPGMTGEKLAIKIDVEGHEIPVLEGARRLLKENTCLIQVEVLDEEPQRLEELLARFGLNQIARIGCDVYLCNGL
ncbi:FkbM family methyltransferase [Pseudomonas saliphila]|uniref:FkbM family methyltransferase n=1 Tax=Pseudomonas saliphila TaxID=2586906 RepID=UPI00123956DA|nr:FkbM family methyltransferase [Pseudomonas saliphila]